MNEAATQRGEATPPQPVGSPERRLLASAIYGALLVLAVAVSVITLPDDRWQIPTLVVVGLLTILSAAAKFQLTQGGMFVSTYFLGVMLAVVLLGPAPGALVGTASVIVSRLRARRLSPLGVVVDLAAFAWFPIAGGLLFHAIVAGGHLRPLDLRFYLAGLAAFAAALAVNLLMIGSAQSFVQRVSPRELVSGIQPVLASELFSASLMLVAVYLDHALGVIALGGFAFVLLLFQYLVGELLVSQRRGAELRRLATTDELTGLANRQRFSDHVASQLRLARERGEPLAVMLIDLDRFKEINDTLGHQYGDDLLAQLGPRLVDQAGQNGLVARLGGDEFAVLVEERTDRRDILERVASDLIARIHEPIVIDEISLEVGSSIGVARFPHDGEDVQTLLRRADIAMYAAKEHRDGFRLFDAEQDYHSTRRLSVLGDFRRALNAEEIVVYLQPIIDLQANRVASAEALVRWQHPEMGLIGPGMFLAIIEQTSLIGLLTRQVLDRSIAQCASWRRNGENRTVAVNLSVRNLLDPQLPGDVGRLLDRHGLSPEALRLEITESMVMSDPERAIETVQHLKDLGVRIAVDDFGTGHSSLANLKRLPIHELKIDRSFVTGMLSDPRDLTIVRSTIHLAHDLGLEVVAEGVEDGETLERLAALGCDSAQGFVVARPMPALELPGWAERYTARRSLV